jgi:toxin ParE1/3/4
MCSRRSWRAYRMPRLRLSAAARRDLEMIQDRGLADFGAYAARRHMAGFGRVFALLRAHPFSGEARPAYGEGIRAVSHRPHRVLYRVRDDEILIVRIVHAAMDVRDVSGEDQ